MVCSSSWFCRERGASRPLRGGAAAACHRTVGRRGGDLSVRVEPCITEIPAG